MAMALKAAVSSRGAARRAASMGLLLALAIVLNLAEGMLPALPMMPPGVRLGLSNIVTLYCVMMLGSKEALTIGLLKSGFVLLTRGAAAGFISLCGGMLAILVTMAVFRCSRMSILLKSVCGAAAHNLGQLLAASLYLKSGMVFYYSPVLLVSAIAMGAATAALTGAMMPALSRLAQGYSGQKGPGQDISGQKISGQNDGVCSGSAESLPSDKT